MARLDGGGETLTPAPAPANTAPVFSAAPAERLRYVENATTAIDAAFTLTDNGTTLAGVKIEITGGYQRAEDRLIFTPTAATGDIRIALDATGKPINVGGKMLLESAGGAATLAQWQAAVRAVSYTNISENPTTAARTFTLSASDGELIGTTTRTFDITRVNDAPKAAASLERAVGEEDTVISGRVYAGSDPDGDAITYILEGSPEGITLDADGTWTYTPPADFSGAASFSYRVSDGVLTSAPKTVDIIVEGVSETTEPFEYEYDGLYFEFGDALKGGFQKKVGDSVYLEIGGEVGLDFDVGFGLILSATVPNNVVEVQYGIDLVEKISDVEDTLNKQSFVDTSDWKQGASSISSNGIDPADLEVALDLKAALRAKLDFSFNVGGGISIDFGEIDLGPFGSIDLGSIDESFSESFGGTILDVNTGATIRLFELNGADLRFKQDFELAGISVGSIEAKLPSAIVQSSSTILVDGDKYGNLSTEGQSDSMLKASLDLVGIAAGLLGIPSEVFSGEFEENIGPFYGKLEYDIISAALVGGLALEQEFTFTAGDVDVKMTSTFSPEAATNGQVVNSQTKEGKLGETFTFDTPQGEGSFTVTATYVLDGVLTSRVGIYGRTSFDYSMLGASIGAGVYVDFGIAELEEDFEIGFGPLVDESLGLIEGSLFTLFTTEEDIELTLFTRTYTIEYENFYIGEDNKDDVFTMTRRQVSADGKSGNDRITGNALDNVIQLGEGDDFGFGRGGADKIYGGLGNDDIEGEAGADLLDGGDGNDFLKGGTEDDELIGGLGDDRLEGGADKDRLYGDDGRDYLDGGTGDDLLVGGMGDDILDGGDDADRLFGESGNDLLRGGAGADMLDGGSGLDRLLGGAGDDRLFGSAGNDVLNGGAGKDVLQGDSGKDVFVFFNAAETGDKSAGTQDVIVDFLQNFDKIDLSAMYGSGAAKAGFALITNGDRMLVTNTNRAYDVSAFQESGRTWVVGDINGDGRADFGIELTGLHRLKLSDFITDQAQWNSHFGGVAQAPDYVESHSAQPGIVMV
jgi:Ca2+-binding RTX toxin-like protein